MGGPLGASKADRISAALYQKPGSPGVMARPLAVWRLTGLQVRQLQAVAFVNRDNPKGYKMTFFFQRRISG